MKRRIAALFIGVLLLLALAETNSGRYGISALWEMPYHVQFALFFGAIVCMVYAFGTSPRVVIKKRNFSRYLWGVCGITLLAFALRVWNLENAVHTFVDELHFVYGVTLLWDYPQTNILIPFGDIAAFSWLYPYLQLFSVSIFSATYTGIRMVSIVIGTLTIPAVYVLACALFEDKDRRLRGLIAALLLAVFPPHIHFSRLALNNIADPLFGTLALALLARGWRSDRRMDFALAGAVLGLTQYFYEGGRLLFPPLLLCFTGILLFTNKIERRAKPLNILITFAVAVLIAAPLYDALDANRMPLAMRFRDKNVTALYLETLRVDPAAFLQHYLAPPFLHYISITDGSRFYYAGDTALLLPFVVPFFLIGVLYTLRRPRLWVLILWIAATALGNSLILENTYSVRFVVSFPAVAILTAMGLFESGRFVVSKVSSRSFERSIFVGARHTSPLRERSPFHMRADLTSLPAIVIGAVVILAFLQIGYYFGVHLPRFNVQMRGGRDYIDAVYRSRDLPYGTRVYIVTNDAVFPPHFPILRRFWDIEVDFSVVTAEAFNDTFIEQMSPAPAVVFFLAPDDAAAMARIQAHFTVTTLEASPYNVPISSQYLMVYTAP